MNIYHYTSQSGLLGILTSRKLWVTNVHYLNDSAEVRYAHGIIRKLVGEMRPAELGDEIRSKFIETTLKRLEQEELADRFVGSFSQVADLLSLWRAYSHERIGFSIGFDDYRLTKLAEEQKFDFMCCTYETNQHLKKLTWGLNQAIYFIKGKGLPFAANYLAGYLAALGPIFKHPTFSEEKEWRLVSMPERYDLGESRIKFRPGKSMLIPYKEFKLDGENEQSPITEIVIGPTPNIGPCVAAVEKLLLSSGFASIPVRASQIPLRNW